MIEFLGQASTIQILIALIGFISLVITSISLYILMFAHLPPKVRLYAFRLPFSEKTFFLAFKGVKNIKGCKYEISEINRPKKGRIEKNTFDQGHLRYFNSILPFRIFFKSYKLPNNEESDSVEMQITSRKRKTWSTSLSYE